MDGDGWKKDRKIVKIEKHRASFEWKLIYYSRIIQKSNSYLYLKI